MGLNAIESVLIYYAESGYGWKYYSGVVIKGSLLC